MKLQTDIIELIEEFSPVHKQLIIEYVKSIEDNRISNRNANERLMVAIERIVMEKGDNNDN